MTAHAGVAIAIGLFAVGLGRRACNCEYYANGMARQTASRHGNARDGKTTARLPQGRVEEMASGVLNRDAMAATARPPKSTDNCQGAWRAKPAPATPLSRSIIARHDQRSTQASVATIADLPEGNCRRADVN
jgi:hypothetical protein